LKDLINKSLPENDPSRGLPSSPIQKARYCLIADEFAGEEVRSVFRPLIWTDNEYGGKPQWSAGNTVQIKILIDEDNLQERVRAWMRRSNTALQTFMKEGLLDYLNEKDSTGQPVVEHYERLAKFKQKLNEALNQSKPLIELDYPLIARVHPLAPQTKPIMQGFPFTTGHPARKIVEEILTSQLPVGAPLNGYFSSRDTESVLISSILTHPVHPMTVSPLFSPSTQRCQPLSPRKDFFGGHFGSGLEPRYWKIQFRCLTISDER
jgi:hypothetical protein